MLVKPMWFGSYAALYAVKLALKLGWMDPLQYGRVVLRLLRWNAHAAGWKAA